MKVFFFNPFRCIRPLTLSVQLHTFFFEVITIFHKNTLLTGCPVKRVHITILQSTMPNFSKDKKSLIELPFRMDLFYFPQLKKEEANRDSIWPPKLLLPPGPGWGGSLISPRQKGPGGKRPGGGCLQWKFSQWRSRRRQ